MGAVVRAVGRDGVAVVVKASPQSGEIRAQAEYFRRISRGVPEVLWTGEGVIVLSYLRGEMERGLLGDAACVAALSRMGIWVEAMGGYEYSESLRWIAERLGGEDAHFVGAIEEVMSQATPGLSCVWCHGDLHGENIFVYEGEFSVIDPYPEIAPIHRDLGYWAADPLRKVGARARCDLLSLAFGLRVADLYSFAALGAGQHLAYWSEHPLRPGFVERSRENLTELLGALGGC